MKELIAIQNYETGEIRWRYAEIERKLGELPRFEDLPNSISLKELQKDDPQT